MKQIDRKTLDNLSREAIDSPRKRKNLNFHEHLSDSLQRMLNALEPETYLRPHKHENPDKREIFIILRGRVAVFTFFDDGNIKDSVVLDTKTMNLGIEIPPREWHTVIALESNTVIFEIKDGPYEPMNDKNFASWAPAEVSSTCSDYNNKLLKSIGLL